VTVVSAHLLLVQWRGAVYRCQGRTASFVTGSGPDLYEILTRLMVEESPAVKSVSVVTCEGYGEADVPEKLEP
jgi:hypothetical protein